MQTFAFVRWLDPEKRIAVFRNTETGEEFTVPRSRIIPHPFREAYYRSLGITDPNRLVEVSAENNDFFGIPIWRWYVHKKKTGRLLEVTPEEWSETFYLPEDIDFKCVRDCILEEGGRTRYCLFKCSPTLSRYANTARSFQD